MTETGVPIDVYLVHAKCDNCDTGLLLPTGRTGGVMGVNGAGQAQQPKFEHICNNRECRTTEFLEGAYPVQRLVPKKDEQPRPWSEIAPANETRLRAGGG